MEFVHCGTCGCFLPFSCTHRHWSSPSVGQLQVPELLVIMIFCNKMPHNVVKLLKANKKKKPLYFWLERHEEQLCSIPPPGANSLASSSMNRFQVYSIWGTKLYAAMIPQLKPPKPVLYLSTSKTSNNLRRKVEPIESRTRYVMSFASSVFEEVKHGNIHHRSLSSL